MKGLMVKRGELNDIKKNSLNLLMSHMDLEVVYGYIPKGGGIIISNYEESKKVEFIYILEGELQYEDGKDKVSIGAGDFLYHNQLEKSFTIYAIKDSRILNFSNAAEYEEINKINKKLYKVIEEIEEKDQYTMGHCSRVGMYAQRLANTISKPVASMMELMMAANVHDVGKCMIPDEILLKPGRFNDEERKIMMEHSKYSYNILKNSFGLSERVSMIAACHHERYNGSGYPYGLKGEEIPVEARIIAIVDTFDAMTTDRPYQKARSPIDALNEMSETSYEYDPELFERFKELVLEDEMKAR